MSRHIVECPADEALWAEIVAHEGMPFITARGLGYTYRVKRSKDGGLLGEILFDRRAKSITRATMLLAYHNALKVQVQDGCVSGPKKLGVFGASYLYPIFLRLGICTRTTEEENNHHCKEDITMPRPKGSKNRKNQVPADNLDALIAQKQEEQAALESEKDELAARLSEVRAQLRKLKLEVSSLEKKKSSAEAAAAAEATRAAVEARVEELMAEGKGMEEILSLLV